MKFVPLFFALIIVAAIQIANAVEIVVNGQPLHPWLQESAAVGAGFAVFIFGIAFFMLIRWVAARIIEGNLEALYGR